MLPWRNVKWFQKFWFDYIGSTEEIEVLLLCPKKLRSIEFESQILLNPKFLIYL